MNMEWKPINELPEESGYVLIACYHHRIPMVVQGFCKINMDGSARFSEETYYNQDVAITHWMPLPKHPDIK